MAARTRYTGVVAGVERVRSQYAAFELLLLRDVADEDGLPFEGAPYLTCGAQVRRLDLRPGEAITFVAHVEALDRDRSYMGGGAGAPLRLARPAKLARVDTPRRASVHRSRPDQRAVHRGTVRALGKI